MKGKELQVGVKVKFDPTSNINYEMVGELVPTKKGTRELIFKNELPYVLINAEFVTGQQKLRFYKHVHGLPPMFSGYIHIDQISIVE